MPSTNKTPNYLLNSFLGTDKPKRDDFNSDNLKIDAALAGLASQLSSATGELNSKIDSAVEELSSAASDLRIGTYTGDGSESKLITLGAKPRFVASFPVDQVPFYTDSHFYQIIVLSGFASQFGATYGIKLDNAGFVAEYTIDPDSNYRKKLLNFPNQKYFYIAIM